MLLASLAAVALAVPPADSVTPAPPERDYYVYVASESADRVTLVRFGPGGGMVEREIDIGINPVDPDGPHGLGVSPDGKWVYVTTGHGVPYGYLWKLEAATGASRGMVMLGEFPASLQVSPDGEFAYVANFNLHGDMVPSSVSVVATASMLEVARIPTCVMPHGSRLTGDGARQYSTCMMDDVLVEIDGRSLGVARHFRLTKGREAGMTGSPAVHAGHDMGSHGTATPSASDAACSPTWAVPSPDGARVWVACNKSSDIAEIDTRSWTLTRRFAAGPGVYNLGVTRDGRLLVGTNKRGRSVSVFDTKSGKELARIPTKRTVVHGVAISPDDRYAFVSVEGVGAEPGTVEVIDLRALRSVAQVDVAQQAGGIDVWKTEAPGAP
ncbi:MAG TPA: YncE family protein [Gemmatimonadaceae bacterium]|nr:YncE family protein [Gemmatimonadaceae bacterium]